MRTTEELAALVRSTRRELDRQTGEIRTLALAGKRLRAECESAQNTISVYEKAATVLASLGEERQNEAQRQIEELVTRGLQVIFGEDLSFHLIQSVKGKTPVVEFVVRSTYNGTKVDTEVMSARGGGLAATVGFLLRLVVLLLSKQKEETILFLDESFGMLSKEYVPSMVEFMKELVDKTGVQIVLVTHQEEFLGVADRQYRFKLVGGETKVEEL